jgi:hypothetical protein
MNERSAYKFIEERITYLRIQEQHIRRERYVLMKTLRALERLNGANGEIAIPAITSMVVSSNGGHNAQVITSVLTNSAEPMRAGEIAKRAFSSGMIKSAKGLPGVRNIVWTVLRRNPKRFVKVGRGIWNLRTREEIRPVGLATTRRGGREAD